MHLNYDVAAFCISCSRRPEALRIRWRGILVEGIDGKPGTPGTEAGSRYLFYLSRSTSCLYLTSGESR